MPIEVICGDITTLDDVDAIVNAGNESLLGGGGVDGAIHRAAGPGLLSECRKIAEVRPGVRCPTGEARVTAGHQLAARLVIHTVGPVWEGGDAGEEELLESCYRACMSLAAEHGVRSIAFPAISTGVYSFPRERAAEIAVATINGLLARPTSIRRAVACCFDEATAELYRGLV